MRLLVGCDKLLWDEWRSWHRWRNNPIAAMPRDSSVVPEAGTPSALRGKASPKLTEIRLPVTVDWHAFSRMGSVRCKDRKSCAA